MRGLVLLCVMVAGCGKGKPTEAEQPIPEAKQGAALTPAITSPDEKVSKSVPVVVPPPKTTTDDNAPPADGGKDMETYIKDLKTRIPVSIKDFEKAGLKAIKYDRNERVTTMFSAVAISVDRVYLTDKVTGKGKWYTKAALFANDPRFVPGRIPTPWEWVKVEMVP